MKMSKSFSPLLLALALLAAARGASAQNCGLRSAYRLVNSASSNVADFHVDTGWVASAPLFTPGTSTGAYGTTVSTLTCSTYADYGTLRLVGAGHALSNGVGCFFRLVDWYPGPKAMFFDRVTVASTTLPNGTPVQLRGDLRLSGFAQVVGFHPASSFGAELVTNQGPVAALVNSTGSSNGVIQTTVGATLTFTGRLSAWLVDYGVERGTGTASLGVDLTADFGITCLTPGATLQFCSGTNYDHTAAQTLPVGTGCGAAPPGLSSTLPVLGSTCTFTMQGAPPLQQVIHGLAVDGPIYSPFGTCALLLDVNTLSVALAGTSDAVGGWTGTLAIPSAPSLAGFVVSSQNVTLVAGGPFLGIGETSNAVRLRFGF